MEDIDAVKKGDAVKVFDVNGKRSYQPEGGWDGEVVKVGRKLVDITYFHRTDKFRIDNRHKNDGYGHQYYKTLARVARDTHESELIAFLKDYGIQLNYRNDYPIEELEAIAELIKSFKPEGNDSES